MKKKLLLKRMRSVGSISLALVLALGLTACGQSSDGDGEGTGEKTGGGYKQLQ